MSSRFASAPRVLLAVCLCALAMPGFAQTAEETDASAPAHVAYLEGGATIVRDGRVEDAALNLPLVAGDQLRARDGRAEVIYGDGSVLDVDHFTTIDFLSDDLVRLIEGRVRLAIAGTPGRDRVSYRIDTPSGAVRIDDPGEYRIALIGESGGPLDVEVITVRGTAMLINDLGSTEVLAGERAFASASMAPSYAQPFNSAVWDAFDRWAADRRDERTGVASARYLPDDIRGYAGSFDRHGDWRYEQTYGYVWYPRVHVDWRPYYHGRWSYYSPWGWTWIASDPWGWPTHHYGRWGISAGAWFWIPSRRWAPAHVYWATAPGYVGWCPLGWDGRPVLNIFAVNIGTGRRGYGYHDVYRAWTVVPRHSFAGRGTVRDHAVQRNTLERAVPRWSLASAAAPVRPGTVARSTTPIYSAGRATAVRRGANEAGAPAPRGLPEYRRQAPSSSGLDSGTGARATRRAQPGVGEVPRTAAPARSGDLSAPRAGRSTDAPRQRVPYRDLGPGGQSPSVEGNRRGYAPRGVPDAAPGYAPRGVPRTGAIDQGRRPNGADRGRRPNDATDQGRRPGAAAPSQGRRPERATPYRQPDAGGERPVRRNPEYSRPAPPAASGYNRPTYSRPPSSPPSSDRPVYSRPSRPSSSGDRPSSSRPAGPSSGGDRGTSSRPSGPRSGSAPSRATPRGSTRRR